MKKNPSAVSLLLALLLSLVAVPATALRCGHDLISPGDSQAEVRRTCGEPASTRVLTETVSYRTQCDNQGGCIRTDAGTLYPNMTRFSSDTETRAIGEEWTYDFGPRSLKQQLTFDTGGRLISIRSLDWGSDACEQYHTCQ